MEPQILASLALALIAYAAVSGRLERSPITPPMVFVAVGLGLGPMGLGILEIGFEDPFFHLLAELTLVLVLFIDASRIDLRCLRREHTLPIRLLAVGMPLTVVLGTLLALWLFPEFSIWQAAVVAAILAPTDAALGQAVVSNPRVPVRIRQTLNVESGLNDGVALPAVVILLSCLGLAENQSSVAEWTRFTLGQVLLGPLVGVLVGWLGGQLVVWCSRKGYMSHVFQDLSAIALALAAFSWAELVGGNGFIAAFVAGLTLGNTAGGVCECLYELGEAEGQLLTLLVFTLFGATMVPAALAHAGGKVWLYALGSLTVARMVPVLASLVGSGLRWDSRFFLGWFGPRGIASILFGLLLVEEAHPAAGEELLAVVVITVLASILLHGATAYPAAEAYGARLEQAEEEMEEGREVTEMPLRIGST